MPQHRQPPIAIVGIGCLFPQSPDLSSYWRNILDARDCISDVPDDHSWRPEDVYDPDPTAPDATWCTRGGFLDKVPFDPMAHGVPPNMLESIDTTQLLSLIVARECLRDAGVDPDGDGWDRDRVACILGVTGTQEMAITLGSRLQGPVWRKALKRCGVDDATADAVVADIGAHLPTWTEQGFPGLLGNVVAGRIANRLDLGGTNCVVDAACASSLAAVQYAISDLVSGRSDLVLSGGADTLNDAFMFQCFTRTPAFSRQGDARPFDASGDGILIGEGIAILALKRLEDAERDGDRVYAVIRGLGSSSDGRSRSIYAPSSGGQARALRRTYEMADVSLDTIELIEAHGTGTKAGDVAEIGALKAVYAEADRDDRWVALGSVKSQIGHTKSTAGAAGLVKAAMALHHRVLPPTAKVDTPNPKLGLDDSPFYLSDRARPWVRAADHPRRAAVSAFGFGGSNYHLLLEEPTARVHGANPDWAAAGELFLFGAADGDGLASQLDTLQNSEAPTLAHAAREVLAQWTPGQAEVLAFVATAEDLERRIAAARVALTGQPVPGIHHGSGLEGPGKIAFLFPGQGSQYVEMGRTVALRHPAMLDALDRADEHFRAAGESPLSRVVYPAPAWTEAEREAHDATLRQTRWAQPALGAVSMGWMNTLAGFAVRPDLAAGHSYGELVALHAAGALTAEGLLEASRLRGQRMHALDGEHGTMAAVAGPLARIAEVLSEGAHEVVLANRNHPEQGVISGSTEGIAAAVQALEAAGLEARPLQVAAAFHSERVAEAAEPFAADLATLDLESPRIPVWSTVTAAPHAPDPDAIRARLAEQITAPVDFVGVVEGLWDAGARVFVEVGPKAVLSGLARATLADRAATVVAVDPLRARADGDVQLKEALGALAAAGVAIDVGPLLAAPLPLAPRTPGSVATVWLAGANHKNPSTLEPPMPEVPDRPPVARPQPTPAGDTADLGWAAVPTSSSPVSKPPPMSRSEPAGAGPSVLPAPSTSAEALPALADAGDLAALLESTRSTLQAFQAAQARTAEVHAHFLDAWTEASKNFTRLFETHARLVELATTGQAATAPINRSAAPVPAPEPTLPPVLSEPPSLAPPPAPKPTDDLLHGGLAEPGRVALPTAARPEVSIEMPPLLDAAMAVEARSQPRPPSPIAAPVGPDRGALTSATLEAVATKTGYPLEMLELSMDLESDLGVDSIKRVEILGAVQDAIPGIPQLDNERMGALRTLEAVVDYLVESLGGATPIAAPPVGRPHGPDRNKLVDATLEAVATKTGYPREMLELSMDLESDLGVDSIKRVEILGAVQDEIPALPELDNERMGTLRTLDDVVDYLVEAIGVPEVPEFTNPILTTPSKPAREELDTVLLDCVSAKTGYPREMLELSMDLESDLGVDSIKRVEILGAVQDQLPNLPELDNETMGRLRTLRDVADHLASVGAGLGFAMVGSEIDVDSSAMLLVPPSAPGVPVASAAAPPQVQHGTEIYVEPEVALRRRTVQAVERPGHAPIPLAAPVGISVDVHGRAAALLEVLSARGIEAVLIDPDWSDDAAVRAAVPAGVRSIVHLAAAGASDPMPRVRGAFLLAKAAGPALDLFATVSARGGRFGRTDSDGSWIEGAMAGLAKTLHLEQAATRGLALDLNAEVTADQLADALCTDHGGIEVGLGPTPVVLRTVNTPLEGTATSPIEPGDLVVVSGGARGVTAAVVRALAERHQPAFLLLGRTQPAPEPPWADGIDDDGLQAAWLADCKARDEKPSPQAMDTALNAVRTSREVQATLEAIRGAGSEVHYAAVDVRDATEVARAVADRVAQHGPVRGLIHGAGVLADKRVQDKTPEAFDRVFGTKVEGWTSLIAAAQTDALKFAVVFSSVAGRFGNLGQSDYAMANEALVQASLDLAREGVRALAIDWGPWDGGMVTPELKRNFARQGLTAIPLQLGAAALCEELARGGEVEVVIDGPRPNVGSLSRTFGLGTDPWLADHAIDERPVVPVAVVLEWFAQVAREVYPALHLTGVRDLAVLKGIIVENGVAETSLHWASAQPEGGVAALAFELQGRIGPMGRPIVHYRAIVDLGTDRPDAQPFPGSNGLRAQDYEWPVDEAYRKFLFHGPAFRGIDEIVGISDDGIVGWVRCGGPDALGRGGAWQTDPVAVDCALQLMVLWVRDKVGAAALPSLVGDYRQFRAFPTRVACHMEVSRTNNQCGTFSGTLVDEDDNVVARLDHCEYTSDPSMNPSFRARG